MSRVKFIPKNKFMSIYGRKKCTIYRNARRLQFVTVRLWQKFVLVEEKEGKVEPVSLDKLKGFRFP